MAVLLAGCAIGRGSTVIARPAFGEDVAPNRIELDMSDARFARVWTDDVPVRASAVLRSVDRQQICFDVVLHMRNPEPNAWPALVFNEGLHRETLAWTPKSCADATAAPLSCDTLPSTDGSAVHAGELCVANNELVTRDSAGVTLKLGTIFPWSFDWTFMNRPAR